MGRLRALLHAQQTGATRNATTQQPVLHVAHPRECNTQQQAELVRLVNRVADHMGLALEYRAEALEIALADHVAALECYRGLSGARIPEPARNTGPTERREGYE